MNRAEKDEMDAIFNLGQNIKSTYELMSGRANEE